MSLTNCTNDSSPTSATFKRHSDSDNIDEDGVSTLDPADSLVISRADLVCSSNSFLIDSHQQTQISDWSSAATDGTAPTHAQAIRSRLRVLQLELILLKA